MCERIFEIQEDNDWSDQSEIFRLIHENDEFITYCNFSEMLFNIEQVHSDIVNVQAEYKDIDPSNLYLFFGFLSEIRDQIYIIQKQAKKLRDSTEFSEGLFELSQLASLYSSANMSLDEYIL